MRKKLLLALGILVLLIPFSGLPSVFLKVALPLFGVGIIAVAYLPRFRRAEPTPPHDLPEAP
jgi:hypothetical protein